MRKKKLIILCPYPNNGAPSQRFRFEQQLPFLKEHFEIKQLSFWTEKTNNLLYSNGNIFPKIIGILSGIIRRKWHLLACVSADVVFIHREVIPVGSFIFEWIISKIFRKRVVFDFDDAIWHLDTSAENKGFEWLKNPKKTQRIVSYSTKISAGNNYLADFSKKFNNNVVVIPTTIDTNYHKPSEKKQSDKICIGWTGSTTTVKHFEQIVPVLIKIKNKYPKVYFKLIGDGNYSNPDLDLVGTNWNQSTEIEDLQELDIGIMPLPDDEWAKGKCGFKGLQYMALEIPAVMSPVGVNTEIITHGENGLLANGEDEWIEALSKLIESEALRQQLGKAGRKTVIERYSVESQKENYLELLS